MHLLIAYNRTLTPGLDFDNDIFWNQPKNNNNSFHIVKLVISQTSYAVVLMTHRNTSIAKIEYQLADSQYICIANKVLLVTNLFAQTLL